MYTGKTLFAQVMDFLPWTTFQRIVTRHGGDHGVRTLTFAERYRAMAFAQLTYRENLRDIETCLEAQIAKLYHMGFRQPAIREPVVAEYRRTSSAYYATSEIWDDGILDPVDTRNALGIGISCALNAPIEKPGYGVFRL